MSQYLTIAVPIAISAIAEIVGRSLDPDMGGMIPIELSTDPDGAKDTKKPLSIFDTDFETTIALIEGLTTPGV
jgi:hypothetical protein